MATSLTSNRDLDSSKARPKKKPTSAARHRVSPTARSLKNALAHEPDAFWHRSVAGQLKQADFRSSDAAWLKLGKHFLERKSPVELSKLCRSKSNPLLWGIAACDVGDGAEFVSALDARNLRKKRAQKSIADNLQGWLADGLRAQPTIGLGIDSLAVCHALPRLASILEPTLWWDLLERLHDFALDAGALRPIWDGPPQSILTQQLLAGELPAALGYTFPEFVPLRALRETASETISGALDELLDGEGLPQARHLPVLQPLFACWTRCRAMSDDVKKLRFSSAADIQYQWLVRQALRLLRPDCTQALLDRERGLWSRELLRLALDFGGDDGDHAAAASALPASITDADYDEDNLPEAGVNSEWSGLAVLAAGWSKSSPKLAVTYDETELKLDLVSAGAQILGGSWSAEVTFDGQRRHPEDSWDELCWFSDEDVDYLELAIDLAGDLRLERQLLLARHDEILFLVDNVSGGRVGDLRYCGALPLASGIEARPAGDTRELHLHAARPVATVMPLALPEWRIDSHAGDLELADGKIQLHQQARGRAVCCPLFVDLRRRRLEKQRTWRQLTVAEHRTVQSQDTAVGFRAQSGNQQWLYYRSLATPANRTLLGQNTSSECLIGRFLPSGTIEELVEIEAE